MESIHRRAITTSINMENRNLAFHHAVTRTLSNIGIRLLFDRLANDETAHLTELGSLFVGNGEESTRPTGTTEVFAEPCYCEMFNLLGEDISETGLLQIALREKHDCIEWYTIFVDIMRPSRVHDIFARILKGTRTHSQLIDDEYVRIMNSADRTARPSPSACGLLPG